MSRARYKICNNKHVLFEYVNDADIADELFNLYVQKHGDIDGICIQLIDTRTSEVLRSYDQTQHRLDRLNVFERTFLRLLAKFFSVRS